MFSSGEAKARCTAWTVGAGAHQYGRFLDRRDAEAEATRRRHRGIEAITVFEVWLRPDERVLSHAKCELCGERLLWLDGRVVSATAVIVCDTCSVDESGHSAEEPIPMLCWPVEDGYVDAEGEYRPFPVRAREAES